MPIQKTIELFSFNELSKDIRQSMIKHFEVDDWWDQWIIEDIKSEAKEMGIEDFDFQYSGFWSQGDGLSFTGELSSDLIRQIIKDKVNDNPDIETDNISVKIVRSFHHYVHNKTVRAEVEGDLDSFSITNEELENAFNDWKDDLCESWYKTLKDHYEYLIEEETIAAEYDSWGPTFTENGQTI